MKSFHKMSNSLEVRILSCLDFDECTRECSKDHVAGILSLGWHTLFIIPEIQMVCLELHAFHISPDEEDQKMF